MSQVSGQLFLLIKWYSNYIRKNSKTPGVTRVTIAQFMLNGYHYKTDEFIKICRDKSLFDDDNDYWIPRQSKYPLIFHIPL
jgi:hypothetical protein